MGLPEIKIIFETKGLSAIERSERGIVAVILKDDTEGGQPVSIYKSILDVDFSQFTQRNYEYLMFFVNVGREYMLSKDYEISVSSVEIMVKISHFHTPLKRL